MGSEAGDMLWVGILLVVVAGATVGFWLTRRRGGSHRLAAVRQRLRSQAERLPEQKRLVDSEYPVYFGATAVEAWLLQGRPYNALAAANEAVKRSPGDPVAHLYLARTLLHCGLADQAAKALERSARLGGQTAAHRYLAACLAWERLRARGEPRADQVIRILELLMAVLEEEPHFGEAGVLAAAAARRLGLEEEAHLLEERSRPLAEQGADRGLVERLVGREAGN